MTKSELLAWVREQFVPLKLILTDSALETALSYCVDVYNHWGCDVTQKTVTITNVNKMLLPDDIRILIRIYLKSGTGWGNFLTTMKALTGVFPLDINFGDLVAKMDYYASAARLLDSAFHWKQMGSTLYMNNLPKNNPQTLMVYVPYVRLEVGSEEQDIEGVFLQRIKMLFWGQTMYREGIMLSRADMVGVKSNGSLLMSEGLKLYDDTLNTIKKSLNHMLLMGRGATGF